MYAVDYSDEKRQLDEGHFGQGSYHLRDISTVDGEEIPPVTLAHASFSCTDVSVAGAVIVWVCSLWAASNAMVTAATCSACLEEILPSTV